MFEASANGLVDRKIAEMIPKRFHSWAKGLQPRAIARILTDRAVIGERQRYKTVNRKRVPVGTPEPNAFPCIVEHELFDKVQRVRRIPKTGDIANLFAHVARCECYDRLMKFRSKKAKGRETEGFLVCNNKICPARGIEWRYADFEKTFLRFAEEIDDRGLIKEQRVDDRAAIEYEIKLLQDMQIAKQEEIARLKQRLGQLGRKFKQ